MSRPFIFALYDVAVSIAVHTALGPIERLRILQGRSTGAYLDERMGRWKPPTRAESPGRRILLHAVSVGEVAAAGALITALDEVAPEVSVVLSTGNREGRAAAEALRETCPAIQAVTYLPWDRGRAVRDWMERIAPRAVIVMETEIWPNLFGAAKKLGIPLFIANGRVYPRDAARYRLARGFFARVLETATWIGVQSADSRDAFVNMGAASERVEVMGDLKADAPERVANVPLGWRSVLETGGASLVIAGSTHHPEELMLLRTLGHLREGNPDLRLVLAPRHPGRVEKLQRRAEAMSLSTALWSAGPTTGWDVLLIDRIGPLAALFRWADVVVMGGSLAPRGGHNPLEPAAACRSIIMGPSYEHFRDLVDGMLEVGAIRVLPATDDPADAIRNALLDLLNDPVRRRAMGQRALDFLRSQQGIADRYARAIESRIGRSDQS